jgi:hypothetical protein
MPENLTWYPSNPDCVTLNSAGVPYEEFTCLYPTLGSTYFDFEKNYDAVIFRDWMLANPWVPGVTLLLYCGGILAGKAYFRNREPWNLRRSMALWNLGLSVFSCIGFSRVFPHLMHQWTTYTWRENMCHDPESNVGCGSTGFWTQAFLISKFPELFDTFFIIVHKKPLIFLHWYHHISVLIFCWYGYVRNPPTGIIFCTMNYAVHSVMYFYYFLMAVHRKPKWFRPEWITVAQIMQMVLGVLVTVIGTYLLVVEKPSSCYLTFANSMPAQVMYGSYLFLFVQFFFNRYLVRGNKKKTKTV